VPVEAYHLERLATSLRERPNLPPPMFAGVGDTAWVQLWAPLNECTALSAWAAEIEFANIVTTAFDEETTTVTVSGTLDGLACTVHAVTRTKLRRTDHLSFDELRQAATTETPLEQLA
jgi:hypothetical protein